MGETQMVFVLDTKRNPLAPCHPAKARKLLKKGKARVFKKYPFTIILEKEVEEGCVDEYRIKIDYGSRHTGLAILKSNKSNNEVVWLAQLEHRTDIKSKMDTRRAHRRFRRNRFRYRKPRFNNRTRKEGWIPPSLQSRVAHIQSWMNKLQKLIPLTRISYENVKFDTQLMRDPEISGVEYQQGTLQGYEIREYLLEKYQRKCVYCRKKDIPLEVEHIIPKSRGGTNRVDNLTIACHGCNQAKGNKTAAEFGHPHVQAQVKKTLKDAAVVTATRWKVFEVIKSTELDVECGTGARTKMNRINMNLPKDHHYDACCVGESTPDHLHFKTENVLYIKATGRGNYSRTTLNKYGFPKAYLPRQKQFFDFQSGDMVKAVVPKGKYQGTWYGAVACRSSGSFNINLKQGRIQGIHHKYCQIKQRSDGYKYNIERRQQISSL
jgi:5-methylcytosine-specific restriction endonuclease McrA